MKRMVLVLLLVGCGQEPTAENNFGLGWHYDEIGETGTRVRYGATTDRQMITLSSVETEYRRAMSCAGLNADGPLIIFTDAPIECSGNTDIDGCISLETGTIRLYPRFNNYPYITMRHEFIHYLTLQNGQNPQHDNPLFADCGVPSRF